MTITLCNSQPFTFYLPFHTSLRADQCLIHVPTTCTLGLDPCARHSLFGRTDPYYIDNFYTAPAAFSALPQHFSSPFSVIVLSSQYLFQRGPIWIVLQPYILTSPHCVQNTLCYLGDVSDEPGSTVDIRDLVTEILYGSLGRQGP